MSGAAVAERAPAKVNLYLHVTGRRAADGYHLLDSLAVFGPAADLVEAAPGQDLSLRVEGPEAGALAAEPDNLVLRAARALAAAAGIAAPGAALRLVKRLPVASGVGGGSSDAAAALRALDRLWGLGGGPGAAGLAAIAEGLGADVPVCLGAPAPARMGGIGEVVSPAPALPGFALLLVNPRLALPTPAVFRARAATASGFTPPAALPARWPDAAALARDLAGLRNDLEAPAIGLCPAVAEVLAALRAQSGCLLARMSGSGATCFGIFARAAEADRAAAALPAGWWTAAGRVGGAC